MKFSVVSGDLVVNGVSDDPNSLSKLSKNDSSSVDKASVVVDGG